MCFFFFPLSSPLPASRLVSNPINGELAIHHFFLLFFVFETFASFLCIRFLHRRASSTFFFGRLQSHARCAPLVSFPIRKLARRHSPNAIANVQTRTSSPPGRDSFLLAASRSMFAERVRCIQSIELKGQGIGSSSGNETITSEDFLEKQEQTLEQQLQPANQYFGAYCGHEVS